MNLEQRMYFFTNYQLTGIQKGIQAGHSSLRFALKFGRYNPDHLIWDFIENHQTWVILNGGTTNNGRDFEGFSKGSLNRIADQLLENDIEFSYFCEPDLQDALTAVCFICDERVFNKKIYPDYEDLDDDDYIEYADWISYVGGKKNVFLRELLKGKDLANG
jgi:hypothetical protein